jgi:formamidopyrimidine-DNA glycosylase
MPELPEVETVRIGLSTLLPKKRVQAVTHDWPKSFPNAQTDVDQFLIGATVLDVRRRAKVLMIDLDTNYTLVIHLKMTGQLVFVNKNPQLRDVNAMQGAREKRTEPYLSTVKGVSERATQQRATSASSVASSASEQAGTIPELRFGAGHPSDSLVNELPDKSTRVTFEFSDGSYLYFNDQRKFGWVRLLATVEVPNIDFFQKVGPEPLNPEFTWQEFKTRLTRRKNSNIKAVLLDQTVVAGVGNIYADESLWGAKIHPTTLVRDLSDAKIKLLFQELQTVLQLAIDKGGSSNHTYVNAEGKKGSYMDFARVFRREKLPCPRCGTTIIKTKVAGRGTHICPHCQK